MPDTLSYPITDTNRVKRAHQLAAYDHDTVHRILDSAALCHVAYVIDGQPFVTVTHFDGLVIARSGFHHSANYRTVMTFGSAKLLEDPDEKYQAQIAMVDRLFPGRTSELREVTEKELKATSFIVMDIESAAAKTRSGTVADDEEDYELPIHSEVIRIHTTLGTPEPCPRSHPDATRGKDLDLYQPGVALEEALLAAHPFE